MDLTAQAAESDLFTGLLEAHYPLRVRALHPLVRTAEKCVYRVERVEDAPLVLRAYQRGAAQNNASAQAALLTFLAGQQFPAARVITSTAGALIVRAAGWGLLVTTFVEGRPVVYDPASLRALGVRLGQLHALDPVAAAGAIPPIQRASMTPPNEIRWVSGQLDHVAARVSGRQRACHDWFVSALHRLDRCEGLPVVIIHNDCHPGNAVTTPTGEVVLIDWEGAGLGPAILDLGFLLSSCEIAPSWTPPLPPDPARVRAVLDGYCQYRRPVVAELDRLADAIRFRALIYGAANFAASVAGDAEEDHSWWRARYDAADALSRHVCALLVSS